MRKNILHVSALLLPLLLVFVIVPFSMAQLTSELPTKDMLDAQWKAIEADTVLTQESKDRAKKYYEDATSGLVTLEQVKSSTAKLQRDMDSITTQIEVLKAEVDKPAVEFDAKTVIIPKELEKAEDLLYKVNADYDDSYRESLAIREAIQKRNSKIGSIAQRKSEISTSLRAFTSNEVNDIIGNIVEQMRAKNDLIQIEILQAENDKIDLERDYYSALGDLLPWQQEMCSRKVSYEKKKKEYLEARINVMRKEARLEQAEKAVETQKQIEAKIPGLHSELAINFEILSALQSEGAPSIIISKYEKQSGYLNDVMSSIKENSKVIQHRIEVAGLDKIVGKKLTEQLNKLPDQTELKAEWDKVKNELYEIQNVQLRNNDLRHDLLDFNGLATKIYRDTQTTLPEEQAMDLIKNMLEDRRVLLNMANEENNNLIQELMKLNGQYKEMQETLNEMRLTFSEELIWVQSVSPINFKVLRSAFIGFKSVFAPTVISETGKELWSYFKGKPQYLIFLLFLMLGQCYWSIIIPKRLSKCLPIASREDKVQLRPLLTALYYTALIPIVTYLMCLLLYLVFAQLSNTGSSMIRHFAWGLRILTHVSWIWLLLHYLCIDNGLAIGHLGWNKDKCLRVSKWSMDTFWAVFVVVLVFGGYLTAMELVLNHKMLSVIRNTDIVEYNRLSFCLLSIVLALYFVKLFNPYYGVFGVHHGGGIVSIQQPTNLVWRRVLQLLTVLLSLGIGVGVALGYELCAICFYGFIMYGMMLFTIAAILDGIVSLFLKKSQQHMVKSIIAKFSHLESIVLGESGVVRLGKKIPEHIDNEIHDAEERKDLENAGILFQRMTRMTSVLIWGVASVALFMAFIQFAPALDKIGTVELWRVKVEVPETPSPTPVAKGSIVAVKGAGKTIVADAEMKAIGIRVVRIYDVFAALLYLFGGLFIARNISDVLELFLRQLPFSDSSRYGVRTIASYVIAVIGIVFCFDSLGVTWKSVQWIIAAASVGLGFGLQDIFSNLVSGLIILVERPIRVGDTVTVGTTSGTVIKISMRATVIRDFDYRELIVPNKLIITGQVINASLSTSIVRSQLKISYYKPLDDPNDMVGKLKELVCSIGGVLGEPSPTVILDSVNTDGKAQYNFLIYYYFDSSKHKEPLIRSEFYSMINKRFNKNGQQIGEG